MELLKHDLQHEFPEHLEKMTQLKASDAHFSSLAVQYDAHNHTLQQIQHQHGSDGNGKGEQLRDTQLDLRGEQAGLAEVEPHLNEHRGQTGQRNAIEQSTGQKHGTQQ